MCGIFGFVLSKPLEVSLAMKVLMLLEAHQYSVEKYPVGGHGAGAYFVDSDEREVFVKVGKTNGSPARMLAERILGKKPRTKLLISHVRWASPIFQNTIAFKECTQPYIAACSEDLKVISVHNGFMENYKEILTALRLRHKLESVKTGTLIDSEVLPHFFEEMMKNKMDVATAADSVSTTLKDQKGNTVSMLLLRKNKTESRLIFIHHGKSRGITIWTNPDCEVVFSSRKAPTRQVLNEFLKAHGFKEKISVAWKEQKHVNPTIFSLPVNDFDE
ncbi:MAG: class II glutamine amidotransferase [Candidatus Bathyarchaeia archaeon]|jgi:glucosamine 6-phosphate synthetase-like amidotransferase/phosphosugar isomerase protein|nr:hypothetical protein [Candidatus Bathyarchaeota archaeon A05DMB-4]MDH7595507.1 hypothetical protein [Candidatus Bathyarchaeota archaeon]